MTEAKGWIEPEDENLLRNHIVWDERRQTLGQGYTALLIALASAVIGGTSQFGDFSNFESTLAVITLLTAGASILAGLVRHVISLNLADKMVKRIETQVERYNAGLGVNLKDENYQRIKGIEKIHRIFGYLQGGLWASSLAIFGWTMIHMLKF